MCSIAYSMAKVPSTDDVKLVWTQNQQNMEDKFYNNKTGKYLCGEILKSCFVYIYLGIDLNSKFSTNQVTS